ncbi:Aste57867_15066 [Aphanomyces stellatus]|uniref:Aste57867_15066 protein n=1 Tax=Aphanomyces stellatus TaxID=120398 RepID=A0A485L392_9STRA|nr:hypothetical protein As57867_015010 [Aphanomyces stellatus]VFT91880.1 Aste57867_15066 [Aphanomyces stellatus]
MVHCTLPTLLMAAIVVVGSAVDPSLAPSFGEVPLPLPPHSQSLELGLPADNTDAIDATAPRCSITLVADVTFGFTYGSPYQGQYPAPECAADPDYSLAFLRFSAHVDPGNQFDRIAAVWVDGLELLRTTTQEPSPNVGPAWDIYKEVSHYRHIFDAGGRVSVALDNVQDGTYVSAFHVTVVVDFFKPRADVPLFQRVPRVPDQVVALSNKNDRYHWFSVQPATRGNNFNDVVLPRNVDSLFVEIFTSHHGCDEFYYSNPPNEFVSAVGASCGSGAFRELQVWIDDKLVGAVWPFPLLYTGGLSPALWRPIVSTGAFQAPTYLVDLTPFLALVVDGKGHRFSFDVDYALDYWPTTGNLLVYLDKAGTATVATINTLQFDAHVVPDVTSSGQGSDVTLHVMASRQVVVDASVTTSEGTRHYRMVQAFEFDNFQVYWNGGSNQIWQHRATTRTTTTITNDDNDVLATTDRVHEFTNNGLYIYQPYWFPTMLRLNAVAVNVAPPVRVPLRQNTLHRLVNSARHDNNNIAPGNGFQSYRLNVTLDTIFHDHLTVTGDNTRVGVDGFDLSIVQHGAIQTDAAVGTTSTTSAALAAVNDTGCYSRHVQSVNTRYTANAEGHKCPYTANARAVWTKPPRSFLDAVRDTARAVLGGFFIDMPAAGMSGRWSRGGLPLPPTSGRTPVANPKLPTHPRGRYQLRVDMRSDVRVEEEQTITLEWQQRQLSSAKPKQPPVVPRMTTRLHRPQDEDDDDLKKIIETYTQMVLQRTDAIAAATTRRVLPHCKKRPAKAQQRVFMPTSRIRRAVQSAGVQRVVPIQTMVQPPPELMRIRLINTVPSALLASIAPPTMAKAVSAAAQTKRLPPRCLSATPRRKPDVAPARPQSAQPVMRPTVPTGLDTKPTVEVTTTGKVKLTVHMSHIRMENNGEDLLDDDDT